MSIVKLPMAESPIVGFQHIAYALSIILNDKESLPWYYSNYIQLVSGNSFATPMTFYPNWFDANPLLYIQTFKKEIMKFGNIDIHSFIKDCIDNKTYFYSAFDEFYVPRRRYYGNHHFCHNFLIYGYDLSEQEYILIGFDERRFYGTTSITFAQFEDAFFSETSIPENVHLLERKEGYKYDFNLKLVYETLEDYLYRKNTSERYSNSIYDNKIAGRHWGLDIYKRLREYFELLICGNVLNDIRLLHILYEHKKVMVSRLKYMEDNGYVKNCSYLHENYKNMENKSIVMRNVQLKYSATSDNQYLKTIIDMLSEMEQEEKELMEILLDKVATRLAQNNT
jgi:hypothetical protein